MKEWLDSRECTWFTAGAASATALIAVGFGLWWAAAAAGLALVSMTARLYRGDDGLTGRQREQSAAEWRHREGGPGVPDWVRAAMARPTCRLCGQPIARDGREEHVICRLAADKGG